MTKSRGDPRVPNSELNLQLARSEGEEEEGEEKEGVGSLADLIVQLVIL